MKGFTIFFAMLVGSLSLAIGITVFDLTMRELDLSSTATQSQYAIYAADAGAECVLYWDSKYTADGDGSAFPTSTVSTYPTSGVTCLGHDIAQRGTPQVSGFALPVSNWSVWTSARTATAATTTFTLMLGTAANSSACAQVDVAKYLAAGGVLRTTITSRGFNVCNPGVSPRVERRFEVRY